MLWFIRSYLRVFYPYIHVIIRVTSLEQVFLKFSYIKCIKPRATCTATTKTVTDSYRHFFKAKGAVVGLAGLTRGNFFICTGRRSWRVATPTGLNALFISHIYIPQGVCHPRFYITYVMMSAMTWFFLSGNVFYCILFKL